MSVSIAPRSGAAQRVFYSEDVQVDPSEVVTNAAWEMDLGELKASWWAPLHVFARFIDERGAVETSTEGS